MELNRRHFFELFAAAGASTLASGWLFDRVLALDSTGDLPVTLGPGIESWLPTTCQLCPGGCGMEVRRIDGLPVGVRGLRAHPVNRGGLCALPHAAIQQLLSPDRLRRPLRRSGRRGAGRWNEITWDEAETEIRDRVHGLMRSGKGHRLAFLDGRRPGLGRQVAAAFTAGVGSPHHVAPVEPTSDILAQRMFGWQEAPGADLEHSRIVLLFRFDHLETDGSPVWQNRVFAAARDRTVDRPIFVGVGPRLLGSTSKCDQWLPAAPGTEGIVALAMAHAIIDRGWENREFLRLHSDWPRDESSRSRHSLYRLVEALDIRLASDITQVPQARIETLARSFVEHQPGVALVGPGTLANPTSALTIAAVNLLNVLVGAVGTPGTLIERRSPQLGEVWESTATPTEIAAQEAAIAGPRELALRLLENHPSPIDILFVREANPVFESPLGEQFRRALASEDRTVVAFASELDETAELADIVLPEPTFLERWDILTDTPTFPRGHASLQQPAIPPLFSCRQSEEVLARICDSLGESSRVKFRTTEPAEIVRIASRALQNDPRGTLDPASPASNPPQTPAGTASFAETFAERVAWFLHGAPPTTPPTATTLAAKLLDLPEEPSPSWLRESMAPRTVGAIDRYPFQLVVFRTGQLRDGATTNLPMMIELAGHWSGAIWSTWAEIHPRTAVAAGIADGEAVKIVSEFGRIEAIAHVSEATPPGVVAVPCGFGRTTGTTSAGVGANINAVAAPLPDLLREQTTRVALSRA